ncbi:MAG: HAD-IA family hydrolase [Saccharospirillaceae bacterium]|nr:HAD-IA family hydrolase [Pseudomonadales bacterium]NRB81631.1 HAD-IA family hydrolase [Saccharospirillaceae bacterium]
MIKCLIFDCDGTLVDSEYLCNLALEIKLKQYKVDVSASKLLEKYRGGKLSNILKSLEGEHQIKFNDDFVPEYRRLVDELFNSELKPCLGVQEALDDISLINIHKCVASSGPVQKINSALRITGLAHFFDGLIFSSYDVGSWKPEPGLFLHAAQNMGYAPSECLVVEDSIVGITAAKAAGMKSILFDPYSIHDSKLCAHIIKDMRQLSDQLEVIDKSLV